MKEVCDFCGGEFYKIRDNKNFCARCFRRFFDLLVWELKDWDDALEILRNEGKDKKKEI